MKIAAAKHSGKPKPARAEAATFGVGHRATERLRDVKIKDIAGGADAGVARKQTL